MKWTSDYLRKVSNGAVKVGEGTIRDMLEAFANCRRLDEDEAKREGRVCIVCGTPILRREDFVGLPNGMRCMSDCNLRAAGELAHERLRKIGELQHENAQKLAACDCAAMMDTPESHEKNKSIARDNPFWSPAFDSVMRRTGECIQLRAEVQRLKAELDAATKGSAVVNLSEGHAPNTDTAGVASLWLQNFEAIVRRNEELMQQLRADLAAAKGGVG